MNLRLLLAPLAIVAAASTGCVARGYVSAAPPPVAASTVTYTTVDFDPAATPYVVYEGRPTYYAGGSWYYYDGVSWRGYASGYEPDYLYRQRVLVTTRGWGEGWYRGNAGARWSYGGSYGGAYTAPPAYGGAYTAPPARGTYTAPPAYPGRRYAPARRR